MGEIADDCFDRAMDELEGFGDDLWDEYHPARYRPNYSPALQAERRRIAAVSAARDLFSNLDEPE